MKLHAIALAALLLAAAARAAVACELPAGDEPVTGGDGLTLSYRSDPPGLVVDRHFALIVHICSSVPVTSVSVDAHMPEHRHGMNYKTTVTRLPSGAWRAEGLLFHMPGKWEIVLGIGGERGVRRVTHTILVS